VPVTPWPRRCLRAIFSPWGGTVAAAFGLLILLGCLSIGGSYESHSSPDTDHTFYQEGELRLNVQEERDVYYPEPYVSPPYLEINGKGFIDKDCELLSQQPTHFRIRNLSPFVNTVKWKAKGVRGRVTQTIVPGPPALPTAPVPVEPAASTAKE
jgi:hypothetical protein